MLSGSNDETSKEEQDDVVKITARSRNYSPVSSILPMTVLLQLHQIRDLAYYKKYYKCMSFVASAINALFACLSQIV